MFARAREKERERLYVSTTCISLWHALASLPTDHLTPIHACVKEVYFP